ncbi:hypothetical protein [Gemmatimonas aurantiaca]|uniref:hypothetical protein n=1 Tax=Gemmatimonas aurantiaca TaxID=173480 RepID=UPI00301E0B7F
MTIRRGRGLEVALRSTSCQGGWDIRIDMVPVTLEDLLLVDPGDVALLEVYPKRR